MKRDSILLEHCVYCRNLTHFDRHALCAPTLATRPNPTTACKMGTQATG